MKRLTVITAALAAGLTTVAFADTREELEMEALRAIGEKAASIMDAKPADAAQGQVAGSGEETQEQAKPLEASAKAAEKPAVEASESASTDEPAAQQADNDDGETSRRFAATREERELKTLGYAATDPVTTSSTGAKAALELQAKAAAVGAKASNPYAAIIAKHASANGIPISLATAVVRVESNFRPGARGSAGEVGLMQIKPATARMMGYGGSTKALYDPETNIRWGMKYLAKAHQLGGGDTCGTILRYNAGHAATRMNPVSAGYCAKVKRFLGGA